MTCLGTLPAENPRDGHVFVHLGSVRSLVPAMVALHQNNPGPSRVVQRTQHVPNAEIRVMDRTEIPVAHPTFRMAALVDVAKINE